MKYEKKNVLNHEVHTKSCILVEYVFIYIDKHPCETVYVPIYLYLIEMVNVNNERVSTSKKKKKIILIESQKKNSKKAENIQS